MTIAYLLFYERADDGSREAWNPFYKDPEVYTSNAKRQARIYFLKKRADFDFLTKNVEMDPDPKASVDDMLDGDGEDEDL